MGRGWSRSFSRCTSCGSSDVKHHARGLCRSCYSAQRVEDVGRWPESVKTCAACGAGRSAAYRAAGLCRRCHRRAERAGVLVFWRMVHIVRKARDGAGPREVLISVIRTVGLTATAKVIDRERKETLDLAVGDIDVDEETANRIEAAFLETFGDG